MAISKIAATTMAQRKAILPLWFLGYTSTFLSVVEATHTLPGASGCHSDTSFSVIRVFQLSVLSCQFYTLSSLIAEFGIFFVPIPPLVNWAY
jgi:hypothetical protein